MSDHHHHQCKLGFCKSMCIDLVENINSTHSVENINLNDVVKPTIVYMSKYVNRNF